MNNGSVSFSLNGVDWKKIRTGLLLGLAGVAVTVLSQLSGVSYHLVIANIDLSGVLTLLMTTVYSTLINAVRKFITDNSTN